jgi:predicted metal-dependent enzyme (double-stranded beta helix superfamily)
MATTDTYTLQQFIDDVDRIAREETSEAKITARVAPLLGRLVAHPDAVPLEYRRRPEGKRGRYMLHRAPHFNVTSIIWGPGDTAPTHNHETWGVIGVIENEIEETRYRVTPGAGGGKARVEEVSRLRHGPGAVSCLVPGDEIHGMHNPTSRDTVEIHVYGKDLSGLRRKTWEADGTEKPLISPKYINC